MNIITGYRGEPHITAQEDRDINLGIVGNSLNDVYVLDVGQKLEAEIVTANEIRIRDGILVMQGCAASIDYGAYDSLELSNGALGMKRIDIIAAQYEKDNDTSVETVSLVVVEGTPDAADPLPPALTGGDLQGGDTLIQMPLYYVNIDGVSIDSIDAQFLMCDNSISEMVTTAVTNAELTSGTSTSKRVITPKAIHDYFMAVTTATDTWNGCNVYYAKYGRVVTIKISGSTTNQITGTNGGFLTIKTIPSAYRPRIQYNERKWITATIEAQVQASTSGELEIGYSQNISGGSATGTNIPANSNIRIEVCYISAS